METGLTTTPKDSSFSPTGFDHAQRVAAMLSKSDLVPKEFKGNIQNTMIALEMANRIGASPLMVMQNLYIVHGKPSWSSTFIIAALNACNRFEPLKFDLKGEGDNLECTAWTTEKSGTKEKLTGPKVTMKMAKAEGWVDKNGSKWKTMPELMIRYRAAAFFGRLYAPEIMMGMQTNDEVIDIQPVVVDKESERIFKWIDMAQTLEELEQVSQHMKDEHLDAYTVKKDQLTAK